MKIAALNNIIYQNKIEKQKQTYFRNENVTDVFVKTPVSFCGEAQSNQETIDSILHQLVHFSKKHLKDFPRLAKVYGIPDLCKTVCEVMDKDYMKDTIVDILRQAGITSFKSLEMFIREVSKPKVAENMHDDYIGLVDIYAQLEHKSCLSKYPEILFYIYRSEQESSSPDFSRINRVANFMYETCNAQDTTDFYMGCRFLMPKFGDFNSGFDFIEAAEYLIDTYPQKIELLKDVIHKNKDLKCTPQELYLKAGPIIDYLYELNNGESIGEFSEIAPLVLKLKDVKRYPTECLEYFNASDDFIEQIEFCKLLAKSNVSINEFNQFCKTSILDNTSIIALIKNKNAALEKLDFIGNIKPHEASKLYQDFAQIFALAKQDDETSEIEAYKTITSMVQKYGIKNSDSFCSFYSKHMGVNKKTYSPNEIKEFIELNRFSRSINVIDISRKTKTPVKDILFEQKVLFEAVEPVIAKYLADTKSSFYIGLDAFDIFEKYRNLIQENINNIPALLDALIEAEGDTQEYKNRREKLNLFSSYFSSDEELKEFFAQNQINFDTDEKSERYLQACLAVVKALCNKDDLEFSKQKLTQLSDSGILKNSKSSLADFVESTEEDTLIKIINTMLDRKIPKIASILAVLKRYSDKNGEFDNVLAHLNSMPENYDFQKYLQKLRDTKKLIASYAKGVKIDNQNILNLNFDKIFATKKTSTNANTAILALLNKQDFENYFPYLSDSAKTKHRRIPKIQIAMELLYHCTKSGESYANTFRELGLDKSSFVACNSQEEKENSSRILHAMPDEFIDFLNNDEWNIELENGIANLSTHAKLRLIDRFILQEPGSINKLSSKETIEKIKSILHTIYFEKPTNIIPMKNEKIAVYYKYENRPISAVFTNQGKLVTLMDKYMLVDDSI